METSPKLLFASSFILFTFYFTLFTSYYSNAQEMFQKTYGGTDWDECSSVQQTTDGGYIIVGKTNSFGAGNSDVYLIKTDSIGDTMWVKTYGETTVDKGNSVQQTADGGYIIAGESWTFTGGGEYDVYLIKTDANGDTLWTKTYGGVAWDFGNSIQQTTDGGYIIAGYTLSYGAGGEDVYLIKTDANGDTLWTKTYGGINDDRSYSMQQTTDGGYIIVGRTESFGAVGFDVYLIKTDANGDTLWTTIYGGTGSDIGYSLQQTTDGGYIIAGRTNSYGEGIYDVYLIKTDTVGNTMWAKTYGDTTWDEAYSVQQTTDGGYIIAGNTAIFGSGNSDVYLIKTNATGDTLWTKTYGDTINDYGFSIQQTTDDGYIIAGYTESYGAGGFDVYLTKTDANGNVGCNQLSTNTIVGSTATTVSNPATIVGSGGGVVANPPTIVGSTTTIDSVLCYTTGFPENKKRLNQSIIEVYPNPFSDYTTIALSGVIPSGNEKSIQFQLYDVLGRQIDASTTLSMTNDGVELVIEKGNLTSGLYFFQLTNNSSILGRGKFVVE